MDILIKLYGLLFIYTENSRFFQEKENKVSSKKGFKILSIDYSENNPLTVLDILKTLNIPEKSVALILINGKTSGHLSNIKENDKIELYPFIAGG